MNSQSQNVPNPKFSSEGISLMSKNPYKNFHLPGYF